MIKQTTIEQIADNQIENNLMITEIFIKNIIISFQMLYIYIIFN